MNEGPANDSSSPSTEKKWLYEVILEKIPPFSWFPRGYNTIVQLIAIEIIGMLVGTLFSLPATSMAYGSLVIIVIVTWTALAYHISLSVRCLDIPGETPVKETIRQYKYDLFGSRRNELILAVTFFFSILCYLLLWGRPLVIFWLGGNSNPVLWFFVSLLFWDVSYRLGLGLLSSYAGLKRSTKLARISQTQVRWSHSTYKELKIFRLDMANLLFGLATLSLYPVLSADQIFLAAFLLYSVILVSLSLSSILVIQRTSHFLGENMKSAW